MSELSVFYHGQSKRPQLVGQLASFKKKIYFEYDTAFLNSGLELSPYLLPLKQGAQAPQGSNPWNGLFGVFNDSLPDGWGLLLMDRHLQSLGVDIKYLSPLDRLAYIGDRAMGALSYKPSRSMSRQGFPIDLTELSASAVSIYEGHHSECLSEMAQIGGSPGGARPKVLVHVKADHLISGDQHVPEGYEAWVVKFYAGNDAEDSGRREYAYSLMAKEAGIIMPETRLFEAENGHAWFAIKRFDRKGSQRVHMHTLGGLIDADFRLPSLDYTEVLKVTQALTNHAKDVEQAFMVMVFNVLAKNRDDHSKNFSYLMDHEGVWRLAPAYDLTYSTGINGEHTTSVAGEGRAPSKVDMLKVGQSVGLKATFMEGAFDKVTASINRWEEWCDMAGIANGKRELDL